MFQKLKTDRLFYNQYPYRIVFTDHNNIRNWNARYNDVLKKHYDVLKKNENVRMRVEGKFISAFFKTKTDYENELINLKPYITSVTEPESDKQLEIISNKRHHLCNRYPRGKYQFKIFFKPNTPYTIRDNIVKWYLQQGDAVYFTPSNLAYFVRKKFNWPGHDMYLYTRTSKEVLMASLIGGAHVSSVIEYVLRDSINTEDERETLCQP